MRIFIASLATETNTFSPIPTGAADFDCVRGDEPLSGPYAASLSSLAQQLAPGDELVRGLLAYAQPAGITVRAVYEPLRDELLEDLRRGGRFDVVLLLLHGAMVADGYDDCELDIVSRVRAIVGREVALGVELDLHCHVDARLSAMADVVVTYKEYPHIDMADRLRELYSLCAATQRREIRPVTAVVDCRMVGLYSTLTAPMSGFVEKLTAAEQRPGVLAVSFAHGFPWGDVAHAGGKMIVVADADAALAQQVAEELAAEIYALRHQIGIQCLSMDAALDQAMRSSQRPVVAPDMSDNAGGGAPADSTFVLQGLVQRAARNVGLAFLYDPGAVRIAKAAGVGARLPLRVGGKTGPSSGSPLDLEVTVTAIRENYQHQLPQSGGGGETFALGDVVAIDIQGIHVLLSSRRSQCFSHQAFVDFGLGELDIYIPKSTNHFLAGFRDIAAEVIYMAPPGAIVPDVTLINYQKMTRDKFPWIDQAVNPALSVA